MALEIQPYGYPLGTVNGEECHSEAAVYKRLYHESVERCSVLQEQLERSKGLFSKLKKIEELKEVAIALIAENKAQLDNRLDELTKEKQEWQERLHQSTTACKQLTQECAELSKERDTYRVEHPRVCGRLLAEVALSRAVGRVQEEQLKAKESKENEMTKYSRKMSRYVVSLKRDKQKLSESLDFSEAERETIAESNAELEAEIATYRRYLAEKQKALEEKQATIDELRTSTETDNVSSGLLGEYSNPAPSCRGCGQLRKELGVALKSLDEGSFGKYGDLLRENFTLKSKLSETEREFATAKAEAMTEFERITLYTRDYKTKYTEKVHVLKENLSKADEEISELDQLIDKTREVMHSEINVVKQSPLLLSLIRELDGTEAPETY